MSITLGEVGKTMRDAGFYSLSGVVEKSADFMEQIHAHSGFTTQPPALWVSKDGTLGLMFHFSASCYVKDERKKVGVAVGVTCEELIEGVSKAASRCIRDAGDSVEELINEAA